MRTKTLWIKPEYLNWILSGEKSIEVRIGYSNISRLEPGDRLLLNDEHLFEIVRIGRYPDFETLLEKEIHSEIAPNLSPEQLIQELRQLYPANKEYLGVIALKIQAVDP